MIKPEQLQQGDKVAIVSLSSGILGEDFINHELQLGKKRLEEYGLEVVFMPNALKGIEYIEEYPEKRAEDLKQAFFDDSIKGIICAIGGNDTYRTLPYLLNDEEFKNTVKNNPKIFTGFSDTTINHLMFYQLGLTTFYGPCFLCDLGELDKEMLPYTKEWFNKYFFSEESVVIESSPVWYSEREDFSEKQLGTTRKINSELYGYEVLQGMGKVTGRLLGGCLESMYEVLIGGRYADQVKICSQYNIFPSLEQWKNKIIFLETSEEQPTPEKVKEMLLKIKEQGVFEVVKGLIVGKPQDEKYYNEYKEIYRSVLGDVKLPIIYNVNFGHSSPRCILPYGIETEIDFDNKKITILESIVKEKTNNKKL